MWKVSPAKLGKLDGENKENKGQGLYQQLHYLTNTRITQFILNVAYIPLLAYGYLWRYWDNNHTPQNFT
jgi:hypothetical protein